jgi:hypothetical protein
VVATAEDTAYASFLELHKTPDASILIRSHNAVMLYYQPFMEVRERCHDFVKGEHWTDDEREVAKQKKKALVEFNKLKTSERTFIGSIIQQRYDIKPAPRQPTSQDKSDVYTALYHWTADITETRYKDPGLVRDAWAGGNGWQESYVEITPGRKPRIIVENQNPFAIYPDPNRRDLVANSDCEFIDRVSWFTRHALADAIPDKEDEILAVLPDRFSVTYDRDKVYADRSHEWKNYRNGKYKVIERFYKVRKKMWFGVGPDGSRMDVGPDASIDARNQFKQDYPNHQLHMERQEFLYLAIAVPSMGNTFLYNDLYHCQPRDPVTDRILFPFVELVDEDLDGDPTGHVRPQIGPIKVLNSLMVNKLYSAKNAAAQSHSVSREHYDEDVLEDLMDNHQDGARTFPKKKGAPDGSGVDLIPQGKASVDADASIEFVANFTEEVSSTPPSMKGQSEGNVPGILNEQRIQQSFIQNQGFTNNYMGFLQRRARLWKYYWKEYFDAQEVIRVLDKKDQNDPDWIAINQIVTDEFGNVQKQNTLDDADAYDITFEDSWRSPTVRDKVRQQIVQLQGTASAQRNQAVSAILDAFFLQLSDAPQDLKNQVQQASQQSQQAANQPPPPDPIRVSLSLQSADLHDPAVIEMLKYSNAIPPDVADKLEARPPQQNIETQAAHADVVGKHLDNLQKLQAMNAAALSPTPPLPGRQEPGAIPSQAPQPSGAAQPA